MLSSYYTPQWHCLSIRRSTPISIPKSLVKYIILYYYNSFSLFVPVFLQVCVYEIKHIICVAVTAVYIISWACDVLCVCVCIYVYICGRVLSNCRNASGAVGNFESIFFYCCASRKRFMTVREKTTDHMCRRRRSHSASCNKYHGPGNYNIMTM